MGLLFAVNVWKKIEDFLIKKCIPFTANNKSKNAQAHDLKILDCSISYHQNTLTPSQHLKINFILTSTPPQSLNIKP